MKKLFFLSAAVLMMVAVSCKKCPKGPYPSVKTLEATEIGLSRACLHAQIDFAGVKGDGVKYGFFWGTSEGALDTNMKAEASLDETNAYVATLSGLTQDTQYWYKAWVEIDGTSYSGQTKSFKTAPFPEGAEDIGLVMTREDGTTYKLYWAKSNLCKDGLVSAPELYGDYFAWGETELKNDYTWSNYKYGQSESGPFSKYNTLSKYGPIDNLRVLETGPDGDDVASKILGDKWRMPTHDELDALKEHCTFTDDTVNGVAGRTATAPNNKSIFFPFAGYYKDGGLEKAGSAGCYWSSSLDEGYPDTACEIFLISGTTLTSNCTGTRYVGQPVRPVYED